MVAETELYDLLGVNPTADDNELKKAYRKASLANHPDKNPGDEDASRRFQEVSSAYETLSDPDTRAAYDRYGIDGISGKGGMGAGPDMEEMFAQMFGGGMGGGFDPFGGMPGMGGGRSQPQRPQSTTIKYQVTLSDLYNGRIAHFNLSKTILCGTCGATGAKNGQKPKECVGCKGRGKVLQQRNAGRGMVSQSWAVCSECKGEGVKVRDKDRCKKCKGERTLKAKSQLNVKIQKGMKNGEKIVLEGEGDQEPGMRNPSSIIIVLTLKDDPTFEVSGLDLLVTINITLQEALLGFSRVILTHLDKRQIKVDRSSVPGKKTKVTRSGDVDRIRGEGMPGKLGEKGDLYVKWDVDWPEDGWADGEHGDKTRSILTAKLPPPKPSAPGEASKTQTVTLESSDIESFGANGDDEPEDWEGEDDEDGPGVQCAQQ